MNSGFRYHPAGVKPEARIPVLTASIPSRKLSHVVSARFPNH